MTSVGKSQHLVEYLLRMSGLSDDFFTYEYHAKDSGAEYWVASGHGSVLGVANQLQKGMAELSKAAKAAKYEILAISARRETGVAVTLKVETKR